jgi:predicted nucleotidyltransferase
MTVADIEIPEAGIADVCQRNGIRRLALFGSVLTGRFSEVSDLDALVEFPSPSARRILSVGGH